MIRFLSQTPCVHRYFIIIRTVETGHETDSNCFYFTSWHTHILSTHSTFGLVIIKEGWKRNFYAWRLTVFAFLPCHHLLWKWVSNAGSSRNRKGRAISGSFGCWYFSECTAFCQLWTKLWFLASRELGLRGCYVIDVTPYVCNKPPTYEPSHYELSKMRTCVHTSDHVS